MNAVLRRSVVIAIAIVLAMATTGEVHGQGAGARLASARHKLDHNLRQAVDGGEREHRVIIRVRPGQRGALQQSLEARGDEVIADHESIEALTARVRTSDLDDIAGRDGVISVSTDAVVHAKLLGGLLGGVLHVVTGVVNTLGSLVGVVLLPNGADTDGPAIAPEVLRETLGVGSTWTGRGVGVAIVDSGLEMSSEFENRLTAFYDFTRGGIRTYAYDDYGHGTHIASTIGGSGALSYNRDYRGIAPRVNLVVLKVLDKNGAGYTSDVIRAVDFAVANRRTLKIDIINLSLGHPIYEPAASDPLVQAVERAVRAGLIVVTAAGNYGKNPETGLPGYAGISSPGNAPSAITVGALRTQDTASRRDDTIPDYSSRGPTWYDGYVKPDIVAPGHNIVAAAAKSGTFYKTYPQLKAPDSDYIRMSGTSMATAVTTGVIALMLEANRAANDYPYNPSLTQNAVKAMLQYSSVSVRNPQGLEYDPLVEGAGAINAKGAIDLARYADTSARVGSPWLRYTPAPRSTIAGESLTWKQVVVWGTVFVWGTAIIDVNQEAWGSVFVWGTDTTMANVFVWGTDIVWTDPQSWADVVVWGTAMTGAVNGDVVVWGTTGGTADTTAWGNLEATGVSGAVSATSIAPGTSPSGTRRR
jgi:serine protease AprX